MSDCLSPVLFGISIELKQSWRMTLLIVIMMVVLLFNNIILSFYSLDVFVLLFQVEYEGNAFLKVIGD